MPVATDKPTKWELAFQEMKECLLKAPGYVKGRPEEVYNSDVNDLLTIAWDYAYSAAREDVEKELCNEYATNMEQETKKLRYQLTGVTMLRDKYKNQLDAVKDILIKSLQTKRSEYDED